MNKYQERRKQLQNMRNRRLTSSDKGNIVVSNQMYYYIWGKHNGHRICLGPYNSEDEAWNMMYSKNIQGDVYPLRTRDYSAAKSILKHKSLNNESVTIEDAMQPAYKD